MKSYVSVLLIMILLITGCGLVSQEPPLLVQETQKAIQQARDNLDAVERLQVQELYPHDFQEAYNELINAENYQQEKLYDQAYLSALNSQAASQRIFRQVYRDVIIPSAQQAQTDIGTLTDDDPNNPLIEFLSTLNDILDYSDTIESGQRKIDPEQVLEDFTKVSQIGLNARTTTGMPEISFEPGKYEVSDVGKHFLKKLCETIIVKKREYARRNPDKTIIIKIKTVGYADQIDFREGSGLINELVKGISDAIPKQQPARRQFLNRRLSELRARAANDYLKQLIIQTDQEPPQAQIEQEIAGLGEEIPPEVAPPYPIPDARRRVCRIHTHIMVR